MDPPQYNPFLDISDAYKDARRQMGTALEADDYEAATALCRERLDEYLVDIRWHLHRLVCFGSGIDFGAVVSFNNVVFISTAGGAGELKIR